MGSLPAAAGIRYGGPWEQIFYGEFVGRRRKRVLLKIIGEQAAGPNFASCQAPTCRRVQEKRTGPNSDLTLPFACRTVGPQVRLQLARHQQNDQDDDKQSARTIVVTAARKTATTEGED